MARRDDGRDAAAPEDEDRAGAVAARLVLRLTEHLAQREPVTALADQLLERRPVAAVDVDVERRRAAGVGQETTVEDVRLLAASPRGERARCTGREQHQRGQGDIGEAPSHLETSWFGEEEDARIVRALGQPTIRGR